LDKCRDGRFPFGYWKTAVFIALVQCSAHHMYVDGSEVGRKNKSIHREMVGLRVNKVWFFGVDGASAEGGCEDVV
jgi:hypothetical protein